MQDALMFGRKNIQQCLGCKVKLRTRQFLGEAVSRDCDLAFLIGLVAARRC